MPQKVKTIEKRNCKHCNGVVRMRKATFSMMFGNCKNCKRAYALIKHSAPLQSLKLAA